MQERDANVPRTFDVGRAQSEKQLEISGGRRRIEVHVLSGVLATDHRHLVVSAAHLEVVRVAHGLIVGLSDGE